MQRPGTKSLRPIPHPREVCRPALLIARVRSHTRASCVDRCRHVTCLSHSSRVSPVRRRSPPTQLPRTNHSVCSLCLRIFLVFGISCEGEKGKGRQTGGP